MWSERIVLTACKVRHLHRNYFVGLQVHVYYTPKYDNLVRTVMPSSWYDIDGHIRQMRKNRLRSFHRLEWAVSKIAVESLRKFNNYQHTNELREWACWILWFHMHSHAICHRPVHWLNFAIAQDRRRSAKKTANLLGTRAVEHMVRCAKMRHT